MASEADIDLNMIAASLQQHEAVDAATVAREIRDGVEVVTAWVVPNSVKAPALRRACSLQANGKLAGLSLHDPGPDLIVAQKNRTETDFLYREIFGNNAYLRHGIALPDRACIIDVGANIGMFSLYAVRQSPQAQVFAVEPVTELCSAIRANAYIHGASITVLNCAVGSAPGTANFTYYPNNTVMSGYFGDPAEDQGTLRAYLEKAHGIETNDVLNRLTAERLTSEQRTCPVITLTQLVERERISHIDLLKIDVEKAEQDVLAGMDARLWPMVAQIVIEVHDIEGRVDRIASELRSHGFTVTIDHDPELISTHCFTLTGLRTPMKPATAATEPSASWPSRRRLFDDLIAHLQRQLPGVPPPEHFEIVDALPQVAAFAPPPANGLQYASPPLTATEQVLAKLWRKLFNAGDLDADADFFALGGKSLAAFRLIVQVEAVFGEGTLPPEVLYQKPRLGDVAAAIDSARSGK